MAIDDASFTAVGGADRLSEGTMQAVEVGGRRVLLTMVEGVAYALGAVCTHERANLDEGMLDGHEIYCPLHFSCFDVRTGEALQPPAEKAVDVYAVRVEDDTIYVSSEPVDPGSLAPDAAGASAGGSDAAPPDPEETLPSPEATDSVRTEDPREPSTAASGGNGAGATGIREPAAVATSASRSPEPSRPAAAEADVVGIAPGPTTIQARVIERVSELGPLETAAQTLASALRPLRESRLGGHLFDLLHGRIMGHSLHPALSDLPIGLWFGMVVLDIADQDDAARILAAAGIAAGLATAATGTADWTVSDGRDRRVGLLHGMLESTALLIVGGSLALRFTGNVLAGQIVGAGGFALSAGSAYLGGHLVLGRGVMVDHTAWVRGPRSWTRAIELAELEDGAPRAATVEHRQVLITREGMTVSAMENACTHAGGPLSLGPAADGVVRCPWHGSCFRLRDGAVVRGPATHAQPMLDARVREGWVEVRGRGRW